MPEIPECLNRRYKALDELIQQLSNKTSPSSQEDCIDTNTTNPGIKLMCDFWNILKEDPDCNLTQAVKQRMGVNTDSVFEPQRVACYMADEGRRSHLGDRRDGKDANRASRTGNESDTQRRAAIAQCRESVAQCRESVAQCRESVAQRNESVLRDEKSCSKVQSDYNTLPLTKVLCSLQEVASFDKKCNAHIDDLVETQKELKRQIAHLEEREKEGVQMLKQADCMWSCMEEAYKKRIAESLERQKILLKELKEVEASNSKWRKNRKELEMQVKHLAKCHQDILEKITQKNNDIKCMDLEIADFKKRIESHKHEAEGYRKALVQKKLQFDKRMASLSSEITTITKKLNREKTIKAQKETEGAKFVKEAREDLQKICKVLMQKKLENEDLKAERDAALSELDLLKQTCEQCQSRCENKQASINEEIKRIDEQIKAFKLKCIRCHQCTDTQEARKLCNDCPKCKKEWECINTDDHCERDPNMDCVCMTVKQKFLDNVFENMFTVLERQSRTRAGKAVANSIMASLKNSRNGKLNNEARQILQDFILHTVKRNLNLTIIGGAVKTRCELDPDTYKQLMSCLKQVKAVKPPQADKATPAKKGPCRRWGGSGECQCPGGRAACACAQRAPPAPRDAAPCPPVYYDAPDPDENVECPHKESTTCGPDCAKQGSTTTGTDIATWRPDPCSESACPYSTNMRAAQCVLGPESLSSAVKTYTSPTPYIPDDLQNLMTCSCEKTPRKPCTCRSKDAKEMKANEVKNCNRNNCELLKNKVHHGNELNKEIYSKDSENFPEILTSTQFINQEIKPIEEYEIKVLKSKVARTNNTLSKDGFTLLTATRSGTFAIELKDETIEMIDRMVAKNPNINVTVKKTDSGQFAVKFNNVKKDASSSYEMFIKKSSSGTRMLRMNSDILSKLQSSHDNDTEILEKNHLKRMLLKNSATGHTDSEKSDMTSNQLYECKEIKTHLVNLFNDKRTITIKIQKVNLNNNLIEIEAPLIKTLSGNIAVDLSNCQGISSDDIVKLIPEERPVFLQRSPSGTIVIIISTPSGNAVNGVVRKSASGTFLLVVHESIPQVKNSIEIKKPKEKFNKLKVRNAVNDLLTEPPAVLKMTPSNNYIVVPDKEYENPYHEVVNEIIENDTAYFASITKPHGSEGSIIINFEELEPNAFLAKTQSGNIRIVQKDDEHSLTRKQISDIVYDVLEKVSKTRKISRESFINKPLVTKHPNLSMSDSNIYKKSCNTGTKDSLTGSHAPIKITYSGQYVVVLEKESKYSLIKNLQTYLQNNYHGRVPVQKTENGDIIIVLNDNPDEKSNYGSLKVTSSGNIYVTIDDDIIKNLTIEDQNNLNIFGTDKSSTHLIGILKDPVNKGVATTCNAKPEECTCDVTKCVCSEIRFEKYGWVVDRRPDIHVIDWSSAERKSDGTFKECDPKICLERCHYNGNINDIETKEPKFFSMPTESEPSTEKNSHFEQCCYVIEAISPCHMDCFETVSNDMLRVSEKCNKAIDKSDSAKNTMNEHRIESDNDDTNHAISSGTKKEFKLDGYWDSLTHLPPQLPAFLRELNYPFVSGLY